MAYMSFKQFCESTRLADAGQFDRCAAAWREARKDGGTESLGQVFCREMGYAEPAFLGRVAEAFGWKC